MVQWCMQSFCRVLKILVWQTTRGDSTQCITKRCKKTMMMTWMMLKMTFLTSPSCLTSSRGTRVCQRETLTGMRQSKIVLTTITTKTTMLNCNHSYQRSSLFPWTSWGTGKMNYYSSPLLRISRGKKTPQPIQTLTMPFLSSTSKKHKRPMQLNRPNNLNLLSSNSVAAS